jgi:phytanoyl-CoA hydroxylase
MNAPMGGDVHENLQHLSLSSADAERVAAGLPLSHRFVLGDRITPVQRAYLAQHGFLVFSQVASRAEVDEILADVDRVQERFLAEGRRKAYGVPIWVGKDHLGRPYVQRFAFLSMYSEPVRRFVTDARFEPVRQLIGEHARVGHDESDGVVFNRYVRAPGSLRPGLGWHTDGLRDIFYGQIPGPMLNVGLHFERITEADGGLRLIPGSHRQGFWGYLFRKPYFVDHRPDPDELAVETWPGDLTVHDGRMWHRVQASPHEGERSIRQSMYVPYVTGPLKRKSEDSATLSYMRVFDAIMRAKGWLTR